MPDTPRITGMHHVAIRSRDFDQSVDFYTDVLGLKPKVAWGEAPNRAVMLDTGGSYVEVFERPNSPATDTTRGFETEADIVLHLCLRVDDCAAMMEKLRTAGVHVVAEMKEVAIANTAPGLPDKVPVKAAFFNGPDGELVELIENELT